MQTKTRNTKNTAAAKKTAAKKPAAKKTVAKKTDLRGTAGEVAIHDALQAILANGSQDVGSLALLVGKERRRVTPQGTLNRYLRGGSQYRQLKSGGWTLAK